MTDGRRPKWDVERAKVLWEANYTTRRITEELGVLPATLKTYARRHGWKRSCPTGRPPVHDWDRAAQLWKDGVSIRQIALQLGCSKQAVARARDQRGWPARPRHHGVTWDVAKARTLWNADVRATDIAKQLGVSPDAIRHHARKHGWPKRDRQWVPAGGRRVTQRLRSLGPVRPRPPRKQTRQFRGRDRIPLTRCVVCESITTLNPCEICNHQQPADQIGNYP